MNAKFDEKMISVNTAALNGAKIITILEAIDTIVLTLIEEADGRKYCRCDDGLAASRIVTKCHNKRNDRNCIAECLVESPH